jgi:hypothetical protein
MPLPEGSQACRSTIRFMWKDLPSSFSSYGQGVCFHIVWAGHGDQYKPFCRWTRFHDICCLIQCMLYPPYHSQHQVTHHQNNILQCYFSCCSFYERVDSVWPRLIHVTFQNRDVVILDAPFSARSASPITSSIKWHIVKQHRAVLLQLL